ncbi:MAG: NAD(+) diphosphatase [Lachnospiraceae bacterium]|nr:NAD(+) diphosphatase [Lachnospiraceae bacterium]
MIQDIGPHIYHNEYHLAVPQQKDCLIAVEGRKVYLYRTDRAEEFIPFERLEKSFREQISAAGVVFLFRIDEISYFLLDPQMEDYQTFLGMLKEMEGVCSIDMQKLRELRPMWKTFGAITAIQLNNWYQNRKFCGSCGSRMRKNEKERAMVCPKCGLTEYPKICPAVIIGVTNGDKLMMTKYAGREFKNYALVAGFTEIGESFEATVRREVMEEVGLKVKNITYYKSQPWAFTDTILAGFFCQLDGSDEYHMDREELSAAEWISREQLPDRSFDISLTSEMIEVFRRKTYPKYEEWERNRK